MIRYLVFSLLLLAVCAPMMGTSTLVYRSMPTPPHWIGIIPKSRVYEYFVGVSDNRNSLEEAKRAAILDALNDALTRQGIEVSSRYQQLTESQRRKLHEELTMEGLARIGLEQVAFYHEEWEYYYGTRVEKKYRAFVLTRSKKLKQDSFIKSAFINLGQRLDACWHSMLIPGWGQIRYGKRGKGRWFMTTEIMALGGLGFFHYRYEKAKDDRFDIQWNLNHTPDPHEMARLRHDLALKDEEIKDMRRYRKYFAWACGGIYALNLLDALLFGVPSHERFAGMRLTRKASLYAKLEGEGPRIGLRVER